MRRCFVAALPAGRTFQRLYSFEEFPAAPERIDQRRLVDLGPLRKRPPWRAKRSPESKTERLSCVSTWLRLLGGGERDGTQHCNPHQARPAPAEQIARQ